MTDRHGKEIPSRGVTVQVDCGGCYMTIVNPYHDDSVEWALRYGNVERMRYVAASLLDSYDYLLSGNINMTEATRRLRLMRAKRRELMDAAIAGKAELSRGKRMRRRVELYRNFNRYRRVK